MPLRVSLCLFLISDASSHCSVLRHSFRMFANQDTGTIRGILGSRNTFGSLEGADGGMAEIDYKSDPDYIYYYFNIQVADFYEIRRVSKTTGMEVPFSSSSTRTAIDLPYKAAFQPVTAMNPANQKVFALAVVKEKDRNGDQQPLGKIMIVKYINHATGSPSSITVKEVFVPPSDPDHYKDITALAWSWDGNYLYASSLDYTPGSRRGRVVKCNVNPFSCAPPVAVSSTDQEIRRLAVDPYNSQRVAAVSVQESRSRNPHVFVSNDGGMTWADFTIAGSPVFEAYSGHAVTFIAQGGKSYLAVGTSGGVFLLIGGTWTPIASDLPKVPIFDMKYSQEDDKLVIAAFGRGVWFLPKAFEIAESKSITSSASLPSVTIDREIAPELQHILIPVNMTSTPPDDFIF